MDLPHLGEITTIAASLDSHVPMSIFFPAWWQDEAGNHPQPYTVIRNADVKAGKWTPLYEVEWSRKYCARLEASSRKELMIWPYHTMIGTPGHTIMPSLYEAIAYHSGARQSQPIFLEKGTIPQTEYYSVLEPEVKVPKHKSGNLNIPFLNILASYDRIYIAGEAKSHCVLETISSIMHYFREKPEIIDRLRVLEDCMSSVAHPVIDFEALATEALDKFTAQGLKLVKAGDSLR
jgi:nicotinamidase-related amidase